MLRNHLQMFCFLKSCRNQFRKNTFFYHNVWILNFLQLLRQKGFSKKGQSVNFSFKVFYLVSKIWLPELLFVEEISSVNFSSYPTFPMSELFSLSLSCVSVAENIWSKLRLAYEWSVIQMS